MDYELHCGDCLEVMKDIDDKSIDMILCDLPYGTTKCKWDVIIPFESLWVQYKRIIKDNGAIVLTACQPFTSKLICSNINQFREHLIWVKHKPSNFACGKYVHLKYHEDIIIFCNGKPTYNPQLQTRIDKRVKNGIKNNNKNWRTVRSENEIAFQTNYQPRSFESYDPDFKLPGTIINIPAVMGSSKEKVDHPTQKPFALFEYLVKTYTNEGEIVLDNCMGSGSAGVAALNTGRFFIGIEKDEHYFEVAKKRIEAL